MVVTGRLPCFLCAMRCVRGRACRLRRGHAGSGAVLVGDFTGGGCVGKPDMSLQEAESIELACRAVRLQ